MNTKGKSGIKTSDLILMIYLIPLLLIIQMHR